MKRSGASRAAKMLGSAFGLILVGATLFWWRTVGRFWASNQSAMLEEYRYRRGFADEGGMLDYLKHHPRDFALVSYTVSEDGLVGAPRIGHQQDTKSPLASIMKIAVLAAYAEEVASGALDPHEALPVSEWERYYLPNADGGAHPDALRDLGIETRENGAAIRPETEVRLSDVAGAMISRSDNAATDYLMARLGDEKVRSVVEEQDLRGQEEVQPLLGGTMLWLDLAGERPALSEQLSGKRLRTLEGLGREGYPTEVRRINRAYAAGEIGGRWRGEGPDGAGLFVYERRVADLFDTKGTARDYARIMAEVARGGFISPEVSGIMRERLDWPMENRKIREKFRDYGAKGGSLAGILNQAVYAVPREGDFAGETRVVVLFVRNMPASAWLGAQDSEGFEDFVTALAADRKFAEKVGRELGTR